MASLEPLRRNRGRYLGETIDIVDVLGRIRDIAVRKGWTIHPILDEPKPGLTALHRKTARPVRRVYLSAGIHGDEPAGPLAVLELLESNCWSDHFDLWLVPCLNPSGFSINTRANTTGRDLNRDYRQPSSAEVRAHVRFLEKLPRFDVSICLHEDWEAKGFYLYELNTTEVVGTAAEAVIEAVALVCPIDPSTKIDGRSAQNGIIRPVFDPGGRPEWPEAFYLIQHKTRLSYTLEAPSDFQMDVRVKALVAAVQAILKAVGAESESADRPGS